MLDMSHALALSPDPRTVAPGQAEHDYGVVRDATTFISEQWRSRPGIEAIAHFCSVTPAELHRVFRRWAGLTPAAFMAAITLDRPQQLLRDRASVLDTARAMGLSGPERQRGLFVTPEA